LKSPNRNYEDDPPIYLAVYTSRSPELSVLQWAMSLSGVSPFKNGGRVFFMPYLIAMVVLIGIPLLYL
jgi:hypothetical protein